MPDESILKVLDKLNLNYDHNLDIPEADCPKDQSHKMLIDPVNRKTWVCRTCQIKGETLDLMYHKCLSDVEALTAIILAELAEFNEKNNSDYNIREITEDTLKTISKNEILKIAESIVEQKKEHQKLYQQLDQYRLSIMNRDLNEGRELNDDIQQWWYNRY